MPIGIGGTSANVAEFGQVTIRGGGRDKLLAAVAVQISGNYKATDLELWTWLLVKNIVVLGHGNRTVDISIANTNPPTTPNDYYGASEYSRLVDGNAIPSVLFEDIGEADETEALARARQIMQANLDRAAEMSFAVHSNIGPLPRKGSTVWIGPTGGTIYKGVCQNARLSISGGVERLELRLVDYTAVNF